MLLWAAIAPCSAIFSLRCVCALLFSSPALICRKPPKNESTVKEQKNAKGTKVCYNARRLSIHFLETGKQRKIFEQEEKEKEEKRVFQFF
jgi:hypothetical protein